jgi:hypothetical protein
VLGMPIPGVTARGAVDAQQPGDVGCLVVRVEGRAGSFAI